ncbi:nuclear transport factor 2 family protein [Streptomyces sp. NPDC048521]|uniref:nuclear transport factor 2 family protein n=1 Tax=Streptomyces sp. NPDC048521 TaxID=3365566 RepID=UPI0037167AD1
MKRNEFESYSAGSPVTAAGARHVLLSYHYEDIGDFDGYASLLADDVTFERPGTPPQHGRSAVLRARTAGATPYRQHELVSVVAEGDVVVVLGRVVQSAPGAVRGTPHGVDFADVFHLSEHSLIRSCRRYYHVPACDGSAPSAADRGRP